MKFDTTLSDDSDVEVTFYTFLADIEIESIVDHVGTDYLDVISAQEMRRIEEMCRREMGIDITGWEDLDYVRQSDGCWRFYDE